MSTEMNFNRKESASAAVPFRDEIFQWPVAKIDSIDVWDLMVNNYLTSPLDRRNLLVASPQFFGPFLEKKKCSIFLGEVLHILHKNNYLDMTIAEFVEYRTISKSCKISIDTCLQLDNHCFQNLHGIDHEHDHRYGFNRRSYACWEDFSILRSIKMDQKVEHYGAMLRNGTVMPEGSHPFQCGFLAFSGVWSGDRAHWLSLLQNTRLILSTIGTEIYHFRFVLSQHMTCPAGELLYEFLGMMPNLRTLILDNLRDFTKGDNRFFEDHPLPNLGQLQVLKTIRAPNEIVVKLISKYGPHLKKIAVSISVILADKQNYMYENNIFSPAINLAELSLPQINTKCNIGDYLKSIVKATSTLKCISVRITIEPCDAQRTDIFQDLSSTLNSIFEYTKLHTLNLFVHGFLISEGNNFFGDNNVRLKLPTLRRLWISILCVEISSIDFILGVSDSLEELVLSLSRSTPEDKGQSEIIQFKNCWKKMEKSNVWKLMPKLQKITINYTFVSAPRPTFHEYISSRPSTRSF